jgi:hypothetical protein
MQMTVELALSALSTASGLAQALIALLSFFQTKKKSSQHRSYRLIILALTAVTSLVIAFLLFRYPQPQPVIVRQSTPCPVVQIGSATTEGANSPAIAGSGNEVTYGQKQNEK